MRSIRTSLMAVMAVAATSLPALADYLVRKWAASTWAVERRR